MRVGGLMLVAVGVLLVTGWWDQVVNVAPGPPDLRDSRCRCDGRDRPRARRADTFTELLRWSWRQLTSMRTALILLLLLALAAIPGSVIPQSDVDSLETSRWQERTRT